MIARKRGAKFERTARRRVRRIRAEERAGMPKSLKKKKYLKKALDNLKKQLIFKHLQLFRIKIE